MYSSGAGVVVVGLITMYGTLGSVPSMDVHLQPHPHLPHSLSCRVIAASGLSALWGYCCWRATTLHTYLLPCTLTALHTYCLSHLDSALQLSFPLIPPKKSGPFSMSLPGGYW